MLLYVILVTCFCCLFEAQATEKDASKIIIIGSGAAGIAAGTHLLQHGYDNITILEAENRIGGRVYTTQLSGYSVDLGGQWVHGEENNIVFEMAWPLGLLERSSERSFAVFSSSGAKIPEAVGSDLMKYYFDLGDADVPEEYKNQSTGEWYTNKLTEYFNAHPDIKPEQREPLLNMLNLLELALDSADSWFNVSVFDDYIECKGDQLINWKERGYGTIIDMLLKKFPHPENELPFVNKTVLNTEVTQINYDNPDGVVRVITANGDQYSADHVLVTPSLGVLKADYETLFHPSLSDEKINAIKNIQYGSVSKIYLFYPERWWPNDDTMFTANFFWSDEDRREMLKDPKKAWILGMHSAIEVEHKAGLLCCWLTGPYAREMESIPEADVFTEVKATLHRFMGHGYNLTEPTEMLRSTWYTNKHFRGTYSYKSPETVHLGAIRDHLAEPITKEGKPRVLFAGEATSTHQFSTIHGAIGSGRREADRLMKYYADQERT